MSKENSSIGLVLGAALSKGFQTAFGSAEKSTLKLGKAIRETDAKLRSVRSIREYESQLEKLRAEQAQAGGTSKELAKDIRAAEKQLLRAQSAAKGYGIALDKLGDEEARLNKEQAKNKRREMGGKIGGAVGAGVHGGVAFAGMALTAGVAAGGAALAFGKQRADEIEALINTTNKLGFASTQAYQEIQLGAAAAGIEQEKFDAATEKMTIGIAEAAATGKGKAAPALAALGLNARKLAQMKPEEQMAALSDALAGVKNEGDRARLTKGIFGQDGTDMVTILGKGSKGLAEIREGVRKTGAVLSESQINDGLKLDDALDRADLAMKGVTNTLGAALVPALVELIEKTNVFVTEHGPQMQALGEVLGKTFSVVGEVIGGIFWLLEKDGQMIGETLGWIETKTGAISKIADLFGGDKAVSAAGPAPKDVFPPVPKNALGNQSGATTFTTHAPITINAAPGQSEQKTAELVAAELNKRDRAQARQQRGALHDGALAAG